MSISNPRIFAAALLLRATIPMKEVARELIHISVFVLMVIAGSQINI